MGNRGFIKKDHIPAAYPPMAACSKLPWRLKMSWDAITLAPRDDLQWASLRWIMWLFGDGQQHPQFLNRGTYGDDNIYGRAPFMSHSADFVLGFGAIEDKYKPALLWTYNTMVEPWESGENAQFWVNKGERSFNAMIYPHRAIHALVNWPINMQPENPEKVLPKHVYCTVNDYFVSRNRWQDKHDTIVTFSTGGGPWGYHRAQKRGSVLFAYQGKRIGIPGFYGHARILSHAYDQDGSFTLNTRSNFYTVNESALLVDMSGKSGSDVVIIQDLSHANEAKLKKAKSGFGRNKVTGINKLILRTTKMVDLRCRCQ